MLSRRSLFSFSVGAAAAPVATMFPTKPTPAPVMKNPALILPPGVSGQVVYVVNNSAADLIVYRSPEETLRTR